MLEPEICPNSNSLRHFLQGELCPAETQRMQDHIRHCAYCRTAALAATNENPTSVASEDLRKILRTMFSEDAINSSPPDSSSAIAERESSNPLPHEVDTPAQHEAADGSTSVDVPFKVSGFEIREEIGRGGMGRVYRARQISLGRDVAIKILPHITSEAREYIDRFQQEAKIAAHFTGSHLLPVIDIVDSNVGPVLVMPLIDGFDLARIISHRRSFLQGEPQPHAHPWVRLSAKQFVEQILSVLEQLIQALVIMEQCNVIHRDIKPSNVLIDNYGQAWLSDFGLARLAGELGLTSSGQQIGTRGYASPEQSRSERDIDSRSDIFSVGVTAYHALALTMPYGNSWLTDLDQLPVPPSHFQAEITVAVDHLILSMLAPNRRDRHSSAAALLEDWARVQRQLRPKNRWRLRRGRIKRLFFRNWWAVAAIIAGMAALSAFLLWPADRSSHGRNVAIVTDPPGGAVTMIPLDEDQHLQVSKAIRRLVNDNTIIRNVPVGDYLVIASIEGFGFHEVYRNVPSPTSQLTGSYPHTAWTAESNIVHLPLITIPATETVTDGMVYFTGGQFTMGDTTLPGVPLHSVIVRPFYLDPFEVTVDEFRRATPEGYLPDQAREFRDDEPVAFVTFNEAQRYAETMGKRIMTEEEYEFAATSGGVYRFPWGDSDENLIDWPYYASTQPSYDCTSTTPPVVGLYSNVVEWTSSRQVPYPATQGGSVPLSNNIAPNLPMSDELLAIHRISRVVRGGPYSVLTGAPKQAELTVGPRFRQAVTEDSRHRGLGFRCARSAQPVTVVVP